MDSQDMGLLPRWTFPHISTPGLVNLGAPLMMIKTWVRRLVNALPILLQDPPNLMKLGASPVMTKSWARHPAEVLPTPLQSLLKVRIRKMFGLIT